MITVVEKWHIKKQFSGQSLEIMQKMDNLVGPYSHEHEGWCDHAKFYRNSRDGTRIVMVYPWRDKESHQTLVRHEKTTLRDFISNYCSADHEIDYYHELPVEV